MARDIRAADILVCFKGAFVPISIPENKREAMLRVMATFEK